MPEHDPAAVRLAELLDRSSSVLVLTGAGISVGSGLATYRGLGSPSDPAQAKALHKSTWHLPEVYPSAAAQWQRRRDEALAARPSAAHLALAELEARAALRGAAFDVLTQNVDGLHQRAGSSSVHEIHGSILRVVAADTEHGTLLRPDAVFFGEQIRHRELVSELAARADLLIVVGTSGNVYPAAALPGMARDRWLEALDGVPRPSAATALIDPVAWEHWQMSDFDLHLPMEADAALPALLTLLLRSATDNHY